MNDQALACSLSGPDLVERVQEWARVAAHATSRHVEDGRVVAVYPRDPALLERLERLIAAEAECCPFMFDVRQEGDEMTVELRVPEDKTGALAGLLGLVTHSAV